MALHTKVTDMNEDQKTDNEGAASYKSLRKDLQS